ncbi:hypothetical protein [Maritalea sp. S77]|uniref:hypothetical protein n=1 Tax=Maritalea sp. S77 TaxID=3415125 RepID=UPI003C7DE5FE
MSKKDAKRVKDAIRIVERAGYSVVKSDHLKKLEMVFKKKALATKVYLSRNEAAIYLGISAKTLANLASLKKQGKGDDPYKARKKNGRVTYCLADLRKAIGARSKKQNGADAKERKSKSKKKEAGKNRKKE